jgi:signal transduction histidine kinase
VSPPKPRPGQRSPHSAGGLRGLAAQLQAAREAERAHLSRELHDELGQTLTSLKLELIRLLSIIDRSQLNTAMVDRLQSLVGLTEISITTTRRLATDLRPPVLDHLGLSEAIRWETSRVEARTGIRCRSVARGRPTLSDGQAIGVFRILQEALTNVVRHAEASAIRITLDGSSRGLVLTVKDNGRGITAAEAADPASIGLIGMRERAWLIGGTLDVSGKKGKGTTVTLRLPADARSRAGETAHAHPAR